MRPGLASCLVLAMLAGLPTSAAAQAGAPAMLAHRAVYDFELAGTRGAASTEAMRSRIVYEFTGSVCAGYTTRFRQITEATTAGGNNVSDLRSESFEDDTGKTFRFEAENFVNNRRDTRVEGIGARADSGEVSVALTRPDARNVPAGKGVSFPTSQIKAMIAAAAAGRNIYESRLYDGSDTGEKVYTTTAVIGARLVAPAPDNVLMRKDHVLDGVPRWPVTMSYFDPSKAGTGEETPVYVMSFDLYANGVSDNIRLDYGDFSLKGSTIAFEPLPQKACP